ncbi:MAG: hypothetical protein D6785_11715 [Planctomycetota bacterium]|nr:MAG: hypothetical protein D6785_11715 [Planctomycetota bacterium]
MIGIFSPLPHEMAKVVPYFKGIQKKGEFYLGKYKSLSIAFGSFGMGEEGACHFFSLPILSQLDGILFVGCAGALVEDIKTLDSFLAPPAGFWDGQKIHNASFDRNEEWDSRLSLPQIPSLTSKVLLSSLEEKKNLPSQGFSLVEMENFFLLQEAEKKGFRKPILFLRVILDSLERDLPPFGPNLTVRALFKNFLLFPHKMFWLARFFPKVQKRIAQLVLEFLHTF